MSQITVRQIEETMMMASDSNGHSIVIGRSADPNFTWAGVKPSDLLLVAAASCSGYDVITILTKQKEPFQGITITCTGEQNNDPPYKFTKIHLHFIVEGHVKEEKLKKAIQLSKDKYCSVTNSLTVPVTSSYEIIPE